jgi:hypothetical protein
MAQTLLDKLRELDNVRVPDFVELDVKKEARKLVDDARRDKLIDDIARGSFSLGNYVENLASEAYNDRAMVFGPTRDQIHDAKLEVLKPYIHVQGLETKEWEPFDNSLAAKVVQASLKYLNPITGGLLMGAASCVLAPATTESLNNIVGYMISFGGGACGGVFFGFFPAMMRHTWIDVSKREAYELEERIHSIVKSQF